MKTLQLNSSIKEDSFSTQYANIISKKLNEKYGSEIVVKNLEEEKVPHLDSSILKDLFGAGVSTEVKHYNDLIAQLKEVNYLVIAAPMYNFSIPTQLKNYFDAICRAGQTFKYTPEGPVGLLSIEAAYVVLSRGGIYSGLTFQEDYIKALLTFIGVKKVNFIFLEGLNMGAEKIASAHQKAQEQLANMF